MPPSTTGSSSSPPPTGERPQLRTRRRATPGAVLCAAAATSDRPQRQHRRAVQLDHAGPVQRHALVAEHGLHLRRTNLDPQHRPGPAVALGDNFLSRSFRKSKRRRRSRTTAKSSSGTTRRRATKTWDRPPASRAPRSSSRRSPRATPIQTTSSTRTLPIWSPCRTYSKSKRRPLSRRRRGRELTRRSVQAGRDPLHRSRAVDLGDAAARFCRTGRRRRLSPEARRRGQACGCMLTRQASGLASQQGSVASRPLFSAGVRPCGRTASRAARRGSSSPRPAPGASKAR